MDQPPGSAHLTDKFTPAQRLVAQISDPDMSLHIVYRSQEGIEILDLKGRLVFGPEDLRLREELDKLLATGKSRVVLNLSAVREMDVETLGTLMLASAKLQARGGGLALVHLNPSHIEDLVAASPVTASVILNEVFEDEQDAINSFFPDRSVVRYDILEYVRSRKPASRKASPVKASPG